MSKTFVSACQHAFVTNNFSALKNWDRIYPTLGPREAGQVGELPIKFAALLGLPPFTPDTRILLPNGTVVAYPAQIGIVGTSGGGKTKSDLDTLDANGRITMHSIKVGKHRTSTYTTSDVRPMWTEHGMTRNYALWIKQTSVPDMRLPRSQRKVLDYLSVYDGSMFDQAVRSMLKYLREHNWQLPKQINVERDPLVLRAVQEYIIKESGRRLRRPSRNRVLIDAHPRIGKTILAMMLAKNHGFKRILVLSSFPQTFDQWIGDTVARFRDFGDYFGMGWNDAGLRQTALDRLDANEPTVVCVSFQNGTGTPMDDKDARKEHIYELLAKQFDCVILDESHHGTETKLTLNFRRDIKGSPAIIGLSGTPFTNILSGITFTTDDTVTWTILDTERAKLGLVDGIPAQEMIEAYPTLDYKMIDFLAMAAKLGLKFDPVQFATEDNFDFNKLMETTPSGDFKQSADAIGFMQAFVGEGGAIGGRKGILWDARYGLKSEVVMITLPTVSAMTAYKRAWQNGAFRRDVEFHFYSTQHEAGTKDAMDALRKTPAGSRHVLFVVNMLRVGMTTPCDTVVMMSNDHSLARYVQTEYRCLNPRDKRNRVTFVDCLPRRAVHALYQMSRRSPALDDKSREERLRILNNTFAITMLFGGEAGPEWQHLTNEECDKMFRAELNQRECSISTMFTEDHEMYGLDFDPFDDSWGPGVTFERKNRKFAAELGQEGMAGNTAPSGKSFGQKRRGAKLTHDDKVTALQFAQRKIALLSILRFAAFLASHPDIRGTKSVPKTFGEAVERLRKQNGQAWSAVKFLARRTGLVVGNVNTFMDTVFVPTVQKLNSTGHRDKIDQIKDLPEEVVFEMIYGVTTDARNQRGEVFTPTKTVNQMLDDMEAADSRLYMRPNKRWLDPCAGTGNFPMQIIDRLDKGLAKEFPDRAKRMEHIVNKMIYAVELDPTNCALLTLRIKLHTGVVPKNIACADSLNFGFWGLRFNYIVGNPPYNPPKNAEVAGTGGRNRLWDKFVHLAMRWLEPKGMICYIHPSGWRKPNDDLYPLMTRKGTFTTIRMFDSAQVQKMMRASIPVDSYVWVEGAPKGSTRIYDVRGGVLELDLTPSNPKRPMFLLNFGQERYAPMFDYADDESRVMFDRSWFATDKPHVREFKDATFKHPVLHGVRKNEDVIWWSSRRTDRHGVERFFGVPKHIVGEMPHVYRVVDDTDGIYGLSQCVIGFSTVGMTKKDAADRLRVLASDEFNEFIAAANWAVTRLDWRLFKHLRTDWYKILPSCK